MKKLFSVLVALFLLTIVACSGGGGGGGEKSSGNTSSKTIDEMTVVMDDGAKYYNEEISKGATSEEAGNMTIEWLKKQEGVTDAYLDDEKDNIIVEDETGITTFIVINGLGSEDNIKGLSLKGVQIIDDIERANKAVSSKQINAVIFQPYVLEDAPHASLLYDALSRKPKTHVEYGNASVAGLASLENYDIIYWIGHGGINKKGTISIGTGEKFTEEAINKYTKDLEELGVNTIKDVSGRFKCRQVGAVQNPPRLGLISRVVFIIFIFLYASVIFQPIAFPGNLNDIRAAEQPIEDSGSGRDVTDQFSPFLKRPV